MTRTDPSEQVPVQLRTLLGWLHVDLKPAEPQPTALRLGLATVVAIAGSLLADALLARAGVTLFPRIRGYPHFRFGDYSKLTIIGVVIACVGWPIVTRLTSTPRWIFLRLAILVTLVLFLPDLYLLHQGQPARAVGVLMCMHVAIAVVTYLALLLLAPAGRRASDAAG